MKIGFNPESIVDLSGKPLAGRVTMYLHDSDVKLDVFTLEGGNFVQAQNPQLLNNAGRLDATLFFEAAIVDVKVERYVGPDGQMSVGSPDTDFEQFDYFEVGFDPQILSVRSSVDTIAELMDADPSSACVDVIGYYAVGDCVPRTYYWDANSQNEVDGGYVIGSNLSDSGRWILLWGDEMMPSSVYGIVPGTNEANISALLGYPLVVGSFLQNTAPVVRFLSGDYSSDVSFSTQKKLYFDNGAKFSGASFSCKGVENVSGVGDYIADFTFTESSASAHSSWFRTLSKFWSCGAKFLYLDDDNYFDDSSISEKVTVSEKVILGSKRLEATYSNGGHVYISTCDIGGRIFNPQKDFVRLSSAHRGDSVFTDAGTWDPGLISQGHHVQYDDTPDLSQFRSVERWYQAINERKTRLGQQMSMTAIDFYGRACPVNIDTTAWGAVKNVQADGGITVKNTVLLENVKGDIDVNAPSAATVTMQGCTVRITGTPINFAALASIDSSITVPGSVGLDPSDTMITVYGGHFNGIIAMSAAHAQSFTSSKSVDFRDVSLETAFTWKLNRINMTRCTGPVSLDLYPVLSGSDYVYNVSIDKCVFTGSSRVWFTLPQGMSSYSALDGKAKFGSVRIVGNSFETSDQFGIKMLRWNPGTLNRLVAQDPGAWEYNGNSGNCPRLSPGAVYNGDSHWPTTYTQSGMAWNKYYGALNIFAPYAWYSDGSINYARDNTGLSPDSTSGQMCMCCTTANAAPLVLLCGYCAGQSLPSDGWDEDLNDLFVLIPAITNGTGTMPAPTTGFTYWYQQSLV